MLLRHAKSSWKDITIPDHERPLNKRGKKDALRLGKILKKQDLIPDIIISSTATRAIETASLIAERCGYTKKIETNSLLYATNYMDYLTVISTISDANKMAMIVGHNPIMEELVQRLADMTEKIPTCTLIHLYLNVESWTLIKEIGYNDLKIVNVIKPKKKEES